MWDFPDDRDVARIGREVYGNGGFVPAVCHGPAALLGITLRDGSYLISGKRVAGFTNSEESAVGLTGVVPFLLQDELTKRGAHHSGAADFQPTSSPTTAW
jgi:putative intracellular protease/amidase